MAWGVTGFFFFSSRRRHPRLHGDWSSDVCSSDLESSCPSGDRTLIPAGPTSGGHVKGPGQPTQKVSLVDLSVGLDQILCDQQQLVGVIRRRDRKSVE